MESKSACNHTKGTTAQRESYLVIKSMTRGRIGRCEIQLLINHKNNNFRETRNGQVIELNNRRENSTRTHVLFSMYYQIFVVSQNSVAYVGGYLRMKLQRERQVSIATVVP